MYKFLLAFLAVVAVAAALPKPADMDGSAFIYTGYGAGSYGGYSGYSGSGSYGGYYPNSGYSYGGYGGNPLYSGGIGLLKGIGFWG